ncbi:Endolytic murein transglycosylase [Tepidimonas alkaliphilus]|uniref:Endolytic murein transglycosylase n=1 Tax=Tepidimonas alkaliphilus TaxID=2588942 RepID=A0A554WDQ6_9BURK|nr:endolytic transglycosylase MltG [Tepidimonas alkaliphilus]TSE21723.1 Endolytic murein transglycosylase [Tepidimonas alkaliphilus]
MAALAVAALALAGTTAAWLLRPLPLRLPVDAEVVDVQIAPGMSARQIAQTLAEAGVDVPAWMLFGWLRLSGQAHQLKAGAYEIAPGTTPGQLLDKLVRGEQALRRVTLIEGWTVRDVLRALRRAEHLVDDLPPGEDPVALARHLGLAAGHAEGRFFPDTYLYPKRGRASEVLRRAARAMDERLAQAWAQRAGDLPLRSPEEALILASLIEKETGHEPDRALIAGVFVNRLRLGMRLQTDPSVIYGLGEAFDGDLRRRDLLADTPYNTYTRAGLPPTPIAMPGWASLLAAVQPAPTPALYFVARGDGTSVFSRTLEEHNHAVRRYQLGR